MQNTKEKSQWAYIDNEKYYEIQILKRIEFKNLTQFLGNTKAIKIQKR
ncbi:hypothetical protein GCM10023261_12080 [Bartonella jaculi]|uniref:Uncharacterized protein n=1 Tax=Bartonella jaculi TaxID=686226 RepID=A0ABP9N6I3_9HYPH